MTGGRRPLLLALCAAALAMAAPAPVFAEDAAVTGDTGDGLDLDKMKMTFADEFDDLSVSAWGPGTRWIAHTPWSGDFGGARFANPKDGFPFTVDDGVLRIESSKDGKGEWRSGLLASVDPKGNGFAQQYGYFETRAQLPTGPGLWPAFWLIGKDRSKSTAEIDVMEYYGDKPDGYSSTVHVWYRNGDHYSKFSRINAFLKNKPGDFHTYGVKIDEKYIRMYFDRQMVWKTETRPEHQQPMYVLLNLGLVDNVTKASAPDPSHMYVDYVHVYALPQQP
ncbi:MULTISPECIES: glycoside hydrolase family 16 protein [unclassified Rhizobium]|uniref:glycoside hydrolase family 16 protein n=1 Tax=unclassified Rhizobium TaxID=2613769 RepID=UPI001A2FE78D|nr:glycoside hydrolase family 16 protein [Rhizobium sp. BG4]